MPLDRHSSLSAWIRLSNHCLVASHDFPYVDVQSSVCRSDTTLRCQQYITCFPTLTSLASTWLAGWKSSVIAWNNIQCSLTIFCISAGYTIHLTGPSDDPCGSRHSTLQLSCAWFYTNSRDTKCMSIEVALMSAHCRATTSKLAVNDVKKCCTADRCQRQLTCLREWLMWPFHGPLPAVHISHIFSNAVSVEWYWEYRRTAQDRSTLSILWVDTNEIGL